MIYGKAKQRKMKNVWKVILEKKHPKTLKVKFKILI